MYIGLMSWRREMSAEGVFAVVLFPSGITKRRLKGVLNGWGDHVALLVLGMLKGLVGVA